MITRFKPERNC